jgi:hypothetical protein
MHRGKLVSSVLPTPAKLPPASAPAPSSAQNNAQRTVERSAITPYFEAGITGGARDAVYVGAAAVGFCAED